MSDKLTIKGKTIVGEFNVGEEEQLLNSNGESLNGLHYVATFTTQLQQEPSIQALLDLEDMIKSSKNDEILVNGEILINNDWITHLNVIHIGYTIHNELTIVLDLIFDYKRCLHAKGFNYIYKSIII